MSGKSETTVLTFSDLASGERFYVAPERRKAMRLPTWEYRKVDDISAEHEGSGNRAIFGFSTPVVRSGSTHG